MGAVILLLDAVGEFFEQDAHAHGLPFISRSGDERIVAALPVNELDGTLCVANERPQKEVPTIFDLFPALLTDERGSYRAVVLEHHERHGDSGTEPLARL